MEHNPPTATELHDELRSDTERVASAATERLQTEADSRKGEAAGQARQLSSALDSAARELGPDSPNWMKSALQQGAHTIEQLAQTVEGKDSRQLVGEVQRLARQHPGSFLAGCAIAGFAAARVFKAGASAGSGQTAGTQDYDPYSPEAMAESRPAMSFTDGGGAAVSVSPHGVGTSL